MKLAASVCIDLRRTTNRRCARLISTTAMILVHRLQWRPAWCEPAHQCDGGAVSRERARGQQAGRLRTPIGHRGARCRARLDRLEHNHSHDRGAVQRHGQAAAGAATVAVQVEVGLDEHERSNGKTKCGQRPCFIRTTGAAAAATSVGNEQQAAARPGGRQIPVS